MGLNLRVVKMYVCKMLEVFSLVISEQYVYV